MDYLNDINTLSERDRLISEIESYKRKDFQSVRKDFLEIAGSIDVNDIYKKLKKMEVVRIVLAIEPSLGILNMISEFFRSNLDQKVIFDFEIDKQILGGIKIIYKGKYFDFSI